MYVGDVGVKSGRITMNFPIPEDIKEFQGTAENAYTDAGWNETYTQIDYSGAPTGYKGGRVVEEPKVVEVGSGQYALQGVFEGLYTGTEVTVSIKTTVQAKDDSDYNADGYAFWDGTAYAPTEQVLMPPEQFAFGIRRTPGEIPLSLTPPIS